MIAGEASTLVHPADFYVGIETPKDWFFTAPGAREPSGARAHAARRATRRDNGSRSSSCLRRWTLAREVAPGRSAHAVSRVVDRVVTSCELVTSRTSRAAARSKRRRAATTLWSLARPTPERIPSSRPIGMYGLGGGAFGWGDDDRARVELVPNKKEYKVGETARVLVKSPFARGRGARHRRTRRRVSLRASKAPSARRRSSRSRSPTSSGRTPTWPCTSCVRASPGKNEELVGRELSHGLRRASHRSRGASPEGPGEAEPARCAARVTRCDVDLAVTDARGVGRTTELAVFAVNEGVLALTGYATPDPVPVFTASRPLGIATLETREALAKHRPARARRRARRRQGQGRRGRRSGVVPSRFSPDGVLRAVGAHATTRGARA